MTMRSQPICFSCKHFRKGTTCDAFPEDIPDPIWLNKADHRKPYPGDQGIQFAPEDAKAAQYATLVFGSLRPAPINIDEDPNNANWLRDMAAKRKAKESKQ